MHFCKRFFCFFAYLRYICFIKITKQINIMSAMKNLLIEQMESIPSPLPAAEWLILDCGVITGEDENMHIEKYGVVPYVFINFARHENLPAEYFDCSLEKAFEGLADSSYSLAINKDGIPVVHWEADFYDAASPDNCRTEYYTETLLTWLKDQFLYDYEGCARDILRYHSTQPDFQNYLSNF